MRYKLGVIGGGNMAEAIIGPAVRAGVLEAQAVNVSDPSADRRAIFEAWGVATTVDNAAAVTDAEQVMIAVKPQMFEQVAADLPAIDTDAQIVLSIMAGVSTQRIEQVMGGGGNGGGVRVVRVMPNTPLLAGAGMSGICRGQHAREGDEQLAREVFRAAGEVVELAEADFDALTAVSGSGPAYAFYLAEAMIDAGESLGLPPEVAAVLTKQTILGAGKLMLEAQDTPTQLRRKVMSPGGTTEAAIKHLDAHDVMKHMAEAVRQAAQRSRELGG